MEKQMQTIWLEKSQIKKLKKLHEEGYNMSALVRKFIDAGLKTMNGGKE